MRKIFILLLLLVGCQTVYSQEKFTVDSKKAINNYIKGRDYLRSGNVPEAIKYLSRAIESEPEFVEAYVIYAEACKMGGNKQKAIEMYKKSILIDPEYFKGVYLNLARLEFELQLFVPAIKHAKKYVTYKNIRRKKRLEAQKIVRDGRFSIKAMENPVEFKPELMSSNINSSYSEYWPAITADEKVLVMTVLIPKKTMSQNIHDMYQEDFYISTYKMGQWTSREKMGEVLNTPQNEGAQSISSDGSTMFFTACNRKGGKGKCDIYFTMWNGENWSEAINMGTPINTGFWESQPSISPDGNTIYFASNRPGGKGGLDIWKSTLTPAGYWGAVENLGDKINTPDDEQSPFIHFDNQTLYFSSRGHAGMGNSDIFYSKRSDTTWSSPKNLGYPINSPAEDIGLTINAKATRAYYSSTRNHGHKNDIYTFEIPEEIKPTPASYMAGKVYNKETKKPVSAEFQLIDLATGEVIMNSWSKKRSGRYLVCLPVNRDYALNVSKPGYLFYSENFALRNTYQVDKPFLKDVPLTPIKVGESIVLRNVFYESDSYVLKEESKIELDKLLELLVKNPELSIEISGHTDNTGTPEHNLSLSKNRARSVLEYLVGKGIPKSRLEFKGYGETKPIDINETEEGKANNRRTEIKILGKDKSLIQN